MSSNNRNNDRGSAPSYSSPSPVASAPRQSAPAHSRAPDPVRVASVQQGSPFRVVDTSARIQVGGPQSLIEQVSASYDGVASGVVSNPSSRVLGGVSGARVGGKRQSILRLPAGKPAKARAYLLGKSERAEAVKPKKRKTIQKTASPAQPGRKVVSKKAASTEKATSTSKASSPEKARENVATCKARPEKNTPKKGGGSGKEFVPWCR